MVRDAIMLNADHHKRRVGERMLDPEFQAEYDRTRQELAQVNAVMQALDSLRVDVGMSKAQLAREIGRNDAVVRRLFTAEVNPELRTVAAIAAALGAEIHIVSRHTARARRGERAAASGSRSTSHARARRRPIVDGKMRTMTVTSSRPDTPFLYAGHTLAEWVPDIVERIVQRFDPERIVLFGSLARGQAGRDSDIDLLVIFDAVADKRATAVALRRAIADVPAPVDFVVADRAEIRRRGRIVGPALGTALREGKAVYERAG
jgi:predicted nucleotidyltransferase/DNA-binding phage protein